MSDYLGLQAVHYASIGGMEAVVRTLVERGVDVEVGGKGEGGGGGVGRRKKRGGRGGEVGREGREEEGEERRRW